MDYIIKIYKDWKLHSEFTEIIPDMDDDYMFEKQSIRESARSLKKYGSTCNHVRNNEVLIRHEVEKTDTLQGIALKYGCTTEQIRRANRLFASDSLFLRQFLLIPVEKGSPYYPKDDRPQSLPPRSLAFNSLSPDVENKEHQNNNCKSMDSITMSPEEESRKSIDEFLGKIDSTIAESRKYVAKSQQSSNEFITSQSDDDLFAGSGSGQKRRVHSLTSTSHQRHSSSGSTADTAQLLNMTQGKKVQSSLQRLEKQQDEFFEL